METLRLSKSVVRVIKLEKDQQGGLRPILIYKKTGRKKKKGTRALRLIEKSMRRLANAQQTYAQSYLGRHNQSNRKKRDGWIRDLPRNLDKASRKGARKLRLNRLPVM